MSVMRAVEQSPKTCTPVSKGEGAVTRWGPPPALLAIPQQDGPPPCYDPLLWVYVWKTTEKILKLLNRYLPKVNIMAMSVFQVVVSGILASLAKQGQFAMFLTTSHLSNTWDTSRWPTGLNVGKAAKLKIILHCSACLSGQGSVSPAVPNSDHSHQTPQNRFQLPASCSHTRKADHSREEGKGSLSWTQ